MMYFKHFGKFIDFKNPKTFNEKIQWLKMYDRNPLYTTMVDKYKVKEYIAEKIGDEYIIPTIGIWKTPEEIDFDSLPKQFVLKWNHDSGSVVICKDKSIFNKGEAIKKLQSGEKRNGFWYGREWPYKNVKPLIIAEKYMTDSGRAGLLDYKVHNFNGVPKVILVCSERFSSKGLHEDFYSTKWKKLDMKRPDYPTTKNLLAAPSELKKMIELSKKLSKDVPFMRTDFYEINGKLYFGEITLYPSSGFSPFSPGVCDTILGSWIKLPISNTH